MEIGGVGVAAWVRGLRVMYWELQSGSWEERAAKWELQSGSNEMGVAALRRELASAIAIRSLSREPGLYKRVCPSVGPSVGDAFVGGQRRAGERLLSYIRACSLSLNKYLII